MPAVSAPSFRRSPVKVVIVGAGIGGLTTAIRLASVGYQVRIVEKNEAAGGRCNVYSREGFQFDTGPTILLMRDVLDELFNSLHQNLDDYLTLLRIHPNYQIHFGDGSRLRVSADTGEMDAELERLSPGSAAGFHRYLEDAGYKYRVSRRRFVERNFLRLHEFATLPNLYYLLRTNTLRPLRKHAARYFRDERLQAAFTFQSMYLGLPPSRAPSVYSLLPYTEITEGIWFPRGGMYSLIKALVRVAQDLGVTVETGCAATGIRVRNRRAEGVETVDQGFLPADVVVSNADLPYTYSHLLPPEASGTLLSYRLPRLNHGCASYLLFIGAPRAYPQATHHTVSLAADITGSYRAIFHEKRLPADPSVYVCVASRTDPSLAPSERDGLFVLAPVPHAGPGVDWSRDESSFKERILARLNALGFDHLDSSAFIHSITPNDMAAGYNLSQASAFGLSHNFSQVGYMRPANKAPGLANVYFVGASTTPGGGVPMVIIGSRLTAERIQADFPHA